MKALRSWVLLVGSLFFLLCISLLPFPYHLAPEHITLVKWLYGCLSWADQSALALSSDSKALWQWLGILFLGSILTSLMLYGIRKSSIIRNIPTWSRLLSVYFLSLTLLKYGLNKVFKWQFYLPEPNILYTTVGLLDKDILFWTSMGTSYGYNIFLGLLEVIPALLLLIRKTRLLGLLMALPVLIHVLAINFGFDISVKAFSSFLVLLCLWCLTPYGGYLWQVLIGTGNSQKPFPHLVCTKQYRITGKVFIIGLIFLEALLPYWQSRNFNDDTALRPPLHGAYEYIEGKHQWPLVSDRFPIKRAFIHRQGYFIVQDDSARTLDYKSVLSVVNNDIQLIDYQGNTHRFNWHFEPTEKILQLTTSSDTVVFQQLQWRKLPLLKEGVHWVVD